MNAKEKKKNNLIKKKEEVKGKTLNKNFPSFKN